MEALFASAWFVIGNIHHVIGFIPALLNPHCITIDVGLLAFLPGGSIGERDCDQLRAVCLPTSQTFSATWQVVSLYKLPCNHNCCGLCLPNGEMHCLNYTLFSRSLVCMLQNTRPLLAKSTFRRFKSVLRPRVTSNPCYLKVCCSRSKCNTILKPYHTEGEYWMCKTEDKVYFC